MKNEPSPAAVCRDDDFCPPPLIRSLGMTVYGDSWRAMRNFTDHRGPYSRDEIWFAQHPPVYTLGQNGRREHILRANGIAVVHSDRGGQVTYHGPGQLIAYLLLDLRRRNLALRDLLRRMEDAVVALLSEEDVSAAGDARAPGVYVHGAKIASIGLRLRRGCTYHGLSLNVAMDLSPFADINPCGFAGLAVTQMSEHCDTVSLPAVEARLGAHLQAALRR